MKLKGLIKEGDDDMKTLTVVYRDGGGTPLAEIIDIIKGRGNIGHSFEMIIDTDLGTADGGTIKAFWDGDGPDYIKSIQVDGEEFEPKKKEK